jgi:hypothetical protein
LKKEAASSGVGHVGIGARRQEKNKQTASSADVGGHLKRARRSLITNASHIPKNGNEPPLAASSAKRNRNPGCRWMPNERCFSTCAKGPFQSCNRGFRPNKFDTSLSTVVIENETQ